MEKEDLKIKLGSEDMVFWRDVVDNRKLDIATSEKNLKYSKAILKMAEQKYKEAEEKFNKK